MSFSSQYSEDITTYGTGTHTPDSLLNQGEQNIHEQLQSLEHISTHQTAHHMGDALENIARSITARNYVSESHELQHTMSWRSRTSTAFRRPSQVAPLSDDTADEADVTSEPDTQGVPPELRNFTSEVIFVLVCSAGQLLFAWFLGDVNVSQSQIKEALGIENTQLPRLVIQSCQWALGYTLRKLDRSTTSKEPYRIGICMACRMEHHWGL